MSPAGFGRFMICVFRARVTATAVAFGAGFVVGIVTMALMAPSEV